MNRFVLTLFFILCFALYSPGADRTQAKIEMPQKGLCAHRGAMDTHPENTLAAFREAIRLGAHMIELDVRFTKDSALVILHDPTVDRTTNGHGRIGDLTLAEVKTLDAGSWKDGRFKGEKIPTLKEVLDIMPVNIWLNVHSKGGEALGREVAKVILAAHRQHQAFLACGKEAAAGARAVAPAIMICNMDRQRETAVYVEQTIERKSDFIQLLGKIDDHLAEYTAALKKHGIRINYCCTDSPDLMKKLFDNGVDFILVNQLSTMMEEAKKLGIEPLRPVFRSEGQDD